MKFKRLFVLFCAVWAINSVAQADNAAAEKTDVFAPAFKALKRSDGLYETNLSATELAKRERENVEANRETLRQLRILLEKSPRGFPARRYDTSEEALKSSENSSNVRESARLLIRESNVRLADGDAIGAMQSRVDCYRLAVKYSRNGMLIDGLISSALVAVAWRDSDKVGSQLDGKTCIEFFNRIEDAKHEKASYVDVLQQEKVQALDGAYKQLKDKKLDPAVINRAFEDGLISLQDKKDILAFKLERIEPNLVTAFDMAIAAAKKPFSSLATPIKTDDAYSQLIISNVADVGTRFGFERNEMTTHLLQAALLLRAHKLGAISESEFKQLLPRDPFSSNQLIVKDSIVYSVGPDGEDDGGEPFKNVWRKDAGTGKQVQANPKVLQYDSVGDIIGPNFIGVKP